MINRADDQINIDASIKVGKRFHNFDDPYFANGTPCFHNGRQGLLQDLLCAVIDVDVDGGRYDHGYAGPWRFNRFYEEGRPCWVDSRRGYIHDQSCGNLIDIDADLSIGRRFYKDDPYFLDGVPCVENGREGVLTNYQCLAVCHVIYDDEVKLTSRLRFTSRSEATGDTTIKERMV
jgi:hypothetical protein